MGVPGSTAIAETGLSTLNAGKDDEKATVIVLSTKKSPHGQALALNQPSLVDASIKDVKVKSMGSRKSLTMHNSIYSRHDTLNDYKSVETLGSDLKKMSLEEKLSKKAIDKYQRKKQRYLKTKRVFDHDKIACLDEATEKRTDLVASLLGSSKEARDI